MTQLGLNNSGCSLIFIVTRVAIILAKSLHAAARILSLYCVYWNRKFVLNRYFAAWKIPRGRQILLSWKFQCGIRKFQMTVANLFSQRTTGWYHVTHSWLLNISWCQKKNQISSSCEKYHVGSLQEDSSYSIQNGRFWFFRGCKTQKYPTNSEFSV